MPEGGGLVEHPADLVLVDPQGGEGGPQLGRQHELGGGAQGRRQGDADARQEAHERRLVVVEGPVDGGRVGQRRAQDLLHHGFAHVAEERHERHRVAVEVAVEGPDGAGDVGPVEGGPDLLEHGAVGVEAGVRTGAADERVVAEVEDPVGDDAGLAGRHRPSPAPGPWPDGRAPPAPRGGRGDRSATPGPGGCWRRPGRPSAGWPRRSWPPPARRRPARAGSPRRRRPGRSAVRPCCPRRPAGRRAGAPRTRGPAPAPRPGCTAWPA